MIFLNLNSNIIQNNEKDGIGTFEFANGEKYDGLMIKFN